jgi:hypothetical protein
MRETTSRYGGLHTDLTGIPRVSIDQILSAEIPNKSNYNSQIRKILKTFDLPINYFSTIVLSTESTLDNCLNEDLRINQSKVLYDGLENCLEIFSMYLK